MNFEDLIRNYDVNLVLLKDKTRLTKKGIYGYFDVDGNVMISSDVRKKYREICTDVGILCQYIPDLGYYLCCLDIDSKDFPLTKVLSKYPTSIAETNHGYHLYYLSPCPIKYKQLTGKEKECCKVDIRGQRDESHELEGNYVRYYPGSVGNLLTCDFNDVIAYCYSLFDIEARRIGDYSNQIEQTGLLKQNNNTQNNIEIFLAYYLYYQKDDWESAYDSAFPYGIQLAGWLDQAAMQRVAWKLMSVSEYYSPRKWVLSFLTGYMNGEKRRPYFGDKSLPSELTKVFSERFDCLDEHELKDLAKYCKDVRLYEILEIICL